MILNKNLKIKVELTYMFILVCLFPSYYYLYTQMWVQCDKFESWFWLWELRSAFLLSFMDCSFSELDLRFILVTTTIIITRTTTTTTITNTIYLVLSTCEALFQGLYTYIISFSLHGIAQGVCTTISYREGRTESQWSSVIGSVMGGGKARIWNGFSGAP